MSIEWGAPVRERSDGLTCGRQGVDAIDQEYEKLQTEFQDVAKTVRGLAEKMQAAEKSGDENAAPHPSSRSTSNRGMFGGGFGRAMMMGGGIGLGEGLIGSISRL